MFLFKFKTIMMVFLLHHADNKWKKMWHDLCILNRKKVIYIMHLYVLPCKYVSLYEEVCFITVSRLLHWILYASNIQYICCCECVTFFVCAHFLSKNQINVMVLLLNYVICLLKSSVPDIPFSFKYIVYSRSFEDKVTPCTNLFPEKNLE
jgi:hypothetical protein